MLAYYDTCVYVCMLWDSLSVITSDTAVVAVEVLMYIIISFQLSFS